jgi:ComF family protein
MSMMSTVTGLARCLSYAVLPVDCATCGKPLIDDPVPFFCRSCWSTLHPLHGPSCPRCGRPFPSPDALLYSPGHLCGPCRSRPPAYTQAWSLYLYVAPLHDAVRLLKYHKKVALADALGGLLQTASLPVLTIDVLIPVPLHTTRLREREYNQSLLLADRLNRRLCLPLSYDNLVRSKRTAPQTALGRTARLKNLRWAFTVLRPAELIGKRVLLVDDVFTTGTTVNECAKTLRKAGSSDVYVITLARTV